MAIEHLGGYSHAQRKTQAWTLQRPMLEYFTGCILTLERGCDITTKKQGCFYGSSPVFHQGRRDIFCFILLPPRYTALTKALLPYTAFS
jgi:hypothetical protein